MTEQDLEGVTWKIHWAGAAGFHRAAGCSLPGDPNQEHQSAGEGHLPAALLWAD